MDKSRYLSSEIKQMGSFIQGNCTSQVLLTLLKDLRVKVILPFLEDIPFDPITISCRWGEWKFTLEGRPRGYSSHWCDIESIKDNYNLEEMPNSVSSIYSGKLFSELTINMPRCSIINASHTENTIDEIGVNYLPDNNNTVWHVFPQKHNGVRSFPTFLGGIDYSVYFENINNWDIKSLSMKIDLFCMALGMIHGNCLGQDYVVARSNNQIIHVSFNHLTNNRVLRDDRKFRVHLGIEKYDRHSFLKSFLDKIDIFCQSNKFDDIKTLLSYYEALYSLYYLEHKAAFCYQIMEAIAKYSRLSFGQSIKAGITKKVIKKIEGKLCEKCLALLPPIESDESINEFWEEIYIALCQINRNSPQEMAEILINYCRHFRNYVFHGQSTSPGSKVKEMRKEIETFYHAPIMMICQGVVMLLGARFLLGCDYEHLKVYYSS